MNCPACGHENPDGARFCNECAEPLPSRCLKCGASNPAGSKFCNECTAPLTGASLPLARSKGPTLSAIDLASEHPEAPLDGERKTVTALFADIKGSTELERDLDPEEARAIVDPVLRLMMDAVHRYGGYVAQSTGDGIFALFGAPVAHEDHAQRALHAALAMQQELRQHGEKLKSQGRPPVEARIGINTGEVVMRTIHTGGHPEYTPVGHVTNLAARMQTVAPIGGIAISGDTRRLVEGYFELRDLGPTAIKGIAEPVNVFEVVGMGPLRAHFELAARRGLTHFVGRERELGELNRVLELARSGLGQIVAVVADAGTGKSRLVYEFKATLPSDCRVLEAYAVSTGKASAWLPVLELLHTYFRMEGADDPSTRRRKLSTGLSSLDPALSDTLPYLSSLLGIQEHPDPLAQMDPQVQRRRTLEALKRIMLREALEHPLVVIFEDLHWIDSETQALLELLVDSVANARVLLLVSYRPEYHHGWSNKSYYSQLRLGALSREGVDAMLAVLLGNAVELVPLKRLIAERTEGNPFFIEEMVQALCDEGTLIPNGVVKVTRSVSRVRLPSTVQGILAARIDRLPGDHKQLLQRLAVVGHECPLSLARRLASMAEPQVERILADLQSAEFIYEEAAVADTEYVFKHALTQEVAYNSILIEARKLLHERVGQTIEALFAQQLDDHLTVLAHHYGRSNNMDKAIEYLGRAGQQAIKRSAYFDAITSFSTAIDLLHKLPDSPERIQRELPLQVALGQASIAIKGWAARGVERVFARAREICERLGDPPELFPALLGVWSGYYLRGELRKAHELGELLLRRAETARDSTLLLYAHLVLEDTLFSMGESVRAKDHFLMAISLYDRARPIQIGFDSGVNCLSYMALILWTLGYPDQALKKGNEAVALAQGLSHPLSLAMAEGLVGYLRQYRREARAAQEVAEHLIALSTEHGFTHWLAQADITRGWAIVEQGDEEGIEQIQKGLAVFRAIGNKTLLPHALCLLAEACIESGRLDEGIGALREAMAAVDEHEIRHYEPEIHRLKGELLLKQDHSKTAEAQNCFQRAIEVARKQSAKSLELRATMSLVRVPAQLNRRDESRTMLADIYNWFTEGFDTADLKDASALLDELSK
jgi:predicted ATPase/class 3 adenylate cyclase